ncbi:unnamed protein product [Bursaphelenchus okinawaensis]|uniref:Uncharacterized protein n=1 Tax=Bursaphelenchus okinawaensis TaxID=465554 RepID=A0A811KC39_9BILA|nr:unnamed protein product [Bursaphelenchus okinawaensis]CAG9100680.1 unnamed protein product [Bursaphelenchus okinawaensis]
MNKIKFEVSDLLECSDYVPNSEVNDVNKENQLGPREKEIGEQPEKLTELEVPLQTDIFGKEPDVSTEKPKRGRKRSLKDSNSTKEKQPRISLPLHPTIFTYSLDGQLCRTEEGRKLMELLREGGWPGAAGIKTLCTMVCDPVLDYCAKKFYPTRGEQREYLTHLLKGFPQANIDILVSRNNDKGYMEKAVYNRRRMRQCKEKTGENI